MIKIFRAVSIFFPVFICIISILVFYFHPSNKYIWVLGVSINLIYLLKFWKVAPIFLIFLFFLLYPLEMYNFFVNGFYISYWSDFQDSYFLNKAVLLNSVFLVSLGSVIYNSKFLAFRRLDLLFRSEPAIFFVSLTLFFICAHFGMSGDTILTAGYGVSEREKSPLFEYSLVFLIVSLLFSGGGRKEVAVCYIATSYFIIKSLLYGGRIEVIQAVLALAYFQTRFFNHWSLKKLYISLFLGFLVILVAGRIRTNPMILIDIFSNPLVLFDFSHESKHRVVSSNYGDVLQASARMIGLVDSGVWDVSFRVKSFFSYLFNIFLFGTEMKEYSNISLLDQNRYGAGGGGLISAQYYVWLGWIGPVVAGSFLGFCIKIGSCVKANNYAFVYMFALLVTFPRWYAYSPISFTKFSLTVLLVYFMFKQLQRWVAKPVSIS
ncbi:hypothetical protein FG062_12315 [Vibrio cholerae]|nr:hypothetical protein [Vibrio cholerae]EGR0600399.1 hypothetical protein [Vibrio cholerae]